MDASVPLSAQGPRALALPRAFTVARVLVGLFLLVAAALKIHGLTRVGVFDASFLFSPQLQVAAIEAEILVGIWLLSGRSPRAAWLAAIGLFAIFGAASLYLALVGQRSCGCLGVIHVNPWGTFALDLAIVAALCICRPPRGVAMQDSNALRRILITTAGGAAIFGILCGSFWLLADNPSRALAWIRGESISVSPRLTIVGSGAVGSHGSFTVTLTNRTDKQVRVIGGTSRCGCVATKDLPVALPPGASRTLTVQMSFTGTPGQFQRRFLLYTDNAAQPVVVSHFRGRVLH